MIKMNENKIYKKIIENFEIDKERINCELKINIENNEFEIEGIYFFTRSHMVSIRYYSTFATVQVIKRENNDEGITEKFEKELNVDELIDKINKMLKN